MTKENKYEQQLRDLGIWNPAFTQAVHELCILEREQSRARKAWKETAEPGEPPSFLDPHYATILKQGAAIQSLREALGLTPKGLRKLKGNFDAEKTQTEQENVTVLDLVREKYAI